MMFHRSFAWIVLALYELCLGSFADASLADTRHYVPPPVKHVAIQFPVYKSSELMVSPCRPEIDGYFGGTSGQPIILEYAFSMDSYENANIDDALEQVREYVMDLVVGAVFPKTCKTRDLQVRELQLVGKVTGFRFDDKMKRDNLHTCKPQDTDGSTCAIYRGSVAVFGKFESVDASRILNMILTSLPSSFSSLLRYGISHIHGASAYSDITTPQNSRPLSSGAILGVCVAVIILVVGIGVLLRFMMMQQSIESTHKMQMHHRRERRVGWKCIFWRHDYIIEDNCDATIASSVCSSYTSVEEKQITSMGRKQYSQMVAGLRLPVRKQRFTNVPQDVQQDDGSPFMFEPDYLDDCDDSPYIVDPDDDDDDDDEGRSNNNFGIAFSRDQSDGLKWDPLSSRTKM